MKTISASNIVLIGMPASGKSTVGKQLAKRCRMPFIDTDQLIERKIKHPLQEIVDSQGYLALRGIEEQCILSLHCSKHVISTGGSAVYSVKAMQHLKQQGHIVFLDLPLQNIADRLDNFSTRGLSRAPNQDLSALYQERKPLYIKYADQQIDCRDLTPDEVCDLLCMD